MNKVKCSECGVLYTHKQSLLRHRKNEHSHSTNSFSFSFKCSVCSGLNEFICFKNKSEFLQHLKDHHNIEVVSETKNFDSFEQFKAWKCEYENENCAKYVLLFGTDNINNFQNKTIYYRCHRSGFYKTRGKGVRHLKTQGSSKIDGYCPSQIKLKIGEDSKCTVTFIPSHVGHQIDIARIFLTQSERSAIASKISSKIPFSSILDEIRDNINDPDDFGRIHLLTRKDLHNIEASFHLSCEAVKHQTDPVSVEAWVNQVRASNDDCILFYKPQGSTSLEYPNFTESDFMLAIMNDAQASMLETYGQDTICIDGTQGLDAYDFELITLIVIDDLRQGFPCAFLFSNRTDKEVMKIFYSQIKEHTNIFLTPNIFMSDSADSFFNAWVEVMGKPSKRLYCSWHVDRAWRKHLRKINSLEKKCQIYKTVRSLMQVRDSGTFSEVLEVAINQMINDSETKDFGNYFREHYTKNTNSWAFCYCLPSGLNASMHIERLHKCLKHIYLQGERTKRLDKTILALMKFLKDTLYDRIICLHKGKITSKIKFIRKNHKTSMVLNGDTVIQHGTDWKVTSSNQREMNLVSVLRETCDCQLVCTDCRTCIHKYTCTCIDSTIKFNMCKHIHLLCQFIKSKDSSNLVLDTTKHQEDDQKLECSGEETISREKEDLLQQACANEKNCKDNLFKVKKEKLILRFKKLLKNTSSFEELELIEKLLLPLEQTITEARTNVSCLQQFTDTDNSKKHKIEPRREVYNFSSSKKKKIELLKPTTEEQDSCIKIDESLNNLMGI